VRSVGRETFAYFPSGTEEVHLKWQARWHRRQGRLRRAHYLRTRNCHPSRVLRPCGSSESSTMRRTLTPRDPGGWPIRTRRWHDGCRKQDEAAVSPEEAKNWSAGAEEVMGWPSAGQYGRTG
jgi:hypothetical protein